MPADPAPVPPTLRDVRVLAFADWYSPEASGGAERAAWEVYRRLGASGALLHVVSAAHGRPHRDPGVDVTVIKGYDLSRFAGGYLAPSPTAFTTGARLARAWRPQVVHSNTIHYTGSIAAARVAQRTGLPLVVTAQLGPLDHLPASSRRFADLYERMFGSYILRRAAWVLAVSEPARQHVIRLGAAPDRVSIAPNAADHDRFGMPPITATDRPLIVSIGRLVANKGPDLLVEAAGELARDGLAFDLALVGDGPMRADLERRCHDLSLADRVTFAGQVTDPEKWLARAEIVVRSSYTEGLSLAVIEAMAAGRCNVVSDIPANKELIRDRENGLLFRCGDAHDLARALRAAITDGPGRERLARAAQADSQQYTWDRMAAEHADAMLRVMGR